MPRNTLSWERCDICGRRTPTSECMIGGRRYRVCPYCLLSLHHTGLLDCPRPLITIPAVAPSKVVAVDEGLIESIAGPTGRITARARRKTRTARRSRKK